ncbi:HAMP domain-containing sensor histidine kinase [Streptococcus anginosus]|uniref:sensor histidine kinase n=1 Tax=Streptococcus anginosus TaxID=1328 RepID=UPI002ED8C244
MKLKHFIIVGYLISTTITVVAIIWSVNTMLISKSDIYFIIGISILASITGALVSLLLLSRVFLSLDKLKQLIKGISDKKFETVNTIKNPTEFKELADAFNEMSTDLQNTFASLEESEKEKGLMIAQLSHDIKTPLTSIQATVEGMLDGVIAADEQQYYLKTISRQTDRLNKLVEELSFITLNTMHEPDTPIEKEEIYLDKLLIDIMSEFQLVIDKEDRDIRISVQPESAKIISNYDKLSRLILNLVSNAFKYSEAGTKLTIDAAVDNKRLTLTVADEGQGIKSEDLEKIFKRLYRVESSRNMKTGGHGLGLYIARELAHQLGGDIFVQSEYGQGSSFSLVLDL